MRRRSPRPLLVDILPVGRRHAMACRDIAPSQNQSDQDRDVFAVAKNGTLRAGRPLYSSFGISGADNVSVISSVVHIHQSTYRKIVLSGQDFTFASLSLLDPQAISAAGINVIV